MDDILKEAREVFALAVDAEEENRRDALEDLRFGRMGEQWPEQAIKARGTDRPMLTLNKMPAFIRQVVNDARQNKPSIKVRPVDDTADVRTAKIYDGLIRNIEYTSNADVAYDTASESAISIGFGYFRISVEHSFDDAFEKDIRVERIGNPFSVYGDPFSTAADSSDWNTAFITDLIPHDRFERMYPGAAKQDWDAIGNGDELMRHWVQDEAVLVAEYWTREEIARRLVKLSDGQVLDADVFEQNRDYFDAMGITVDADRETRTHKVVHRIINGVEVLETTEWAGRYIPIIPVYGDEVNLQGKRYFRSLIRDAKDAQRMYNYWRTTTAELVALAPKTPFIGAVGAFETDFAKWDTANIESHSFLEYDPVAGTPPPQRQPFAGVPAGPLQEALSAADDMKSIMGLYDASLGARSNETSGRAIMARQREGDVSTFHFLDNLTRAVRHAGRVIIDLIPHVYNDARVIRVLGQDGTVDRVPVNQPAMQMPDGTVAPVPQGQEPPPEQLIRFDLTTGKYDLVVDAGPSFTSRREEAALQMTEMIRAFPAAAPVIGDLLAKNLDWPGADEIAERLKTLAPQVGGQQGPDPKMQMEMQKAQAESQARQAELQVKQAELQLKARELQIKEFEAQTDRMRTVAEMNRPQQPPSGGFSLPNI